jgi:2-(1,2-epoxy-1,2-dihydrophenyl)acetyl-CoA isomerase
MTGTVRLEFETCGAEAFAIITLDRADRANSLVPAFVDRLNAALDELQTADLHGLLLRSKGHFFSSGGDVAGFAKLQDEALTEYANHVVGGLQRAVLSLYAIDLPVMVRLQGGVTGGAAGLVFAADLVAMDSSAFVQPYYSEVGFAPDGGWTALLGERVGPARAFSIQALNRRIDAEEALRLGIADRIAAPGDLDSIIDGWMRSLASKSRQTLWQTKRLLRDKAAVARVKDRLEAEHRAFLELITLPETARRMEAFLAGQNRRENAPVQGL